MLNRLKDSLSSVLLLSAVLIATWFFLAFVLHLVKSTNKNKFLNIQGISQLYHNHLFAQAKDKPVSMVILGDSASIMSFHPKYLELDFYNLSQFAISAKESYKILKQANENYQPNLRCVLISHTLFSDKFWDMWWWQGQVSNHRVSYNHLLQLRKQFPEHFYFKNNSLLSLSLKYLQYYMNMSPINIADFQQKLYEEKSKNNIYFEILKENKGSFILDDLDFKPSHLKKFLRPWYKNLIGNFIVDEISNHYFIKISEYARKHHISLLIAHPPFYKSLIKKGGGKYLDDYSQYFKKITKENAIILNSQINLKREDFFDAVHLNQQGAIKYSSYINDELKSKAPHCF
ncbi:MAG: hypothetical protein H6625_05665 [Bdellovibrionaceae bacterium]|nr:hypothetical protein [Pseudobdellovibrionaceae bacterium]